ncbi:hypothetical protein GOEFS_023_00150 [Gordonia effusa NBRC 100432]|uniref:DUF4190 domain-containing protein n=1 Tax=Gordonia effusa NBRC 100432 TaxID=1077974 RepID=H0QWU7_9ACTN|nr:DUF4190 domain-containing protein [Gordonia effusa]GAB17298.1 hypothetical protein GOEFS_023_00150 [Gordonia effusa NBRC 100432]
MPPTNRLAVVALVLSFLGVTWLPGVICGHMARSAIARTGETGDSYALAALWIGYFYAAVTITGAIVYLMIS